MSTKTGIKTGTKSGARANAFRWIGGVWAAPPPPPEYVPEGLRSQFLVDANETFLIYSEFAQVREFAIIEDGDEVVFTTRVVWDNETLQDRAIVQQQGVYFGSVRCFILSNLFAVEPRPEQIIYTRRIAPAPEEPIRTGWRILQITDAEEMYYLDVDQLTA
jgi:hypothetical protein